MDDFCSSSVVIYLSSPFAHSNSSPSPRPPFHAHRQRLIPISPLAILTAQTFRFSSKLCHPTIDIMEQRSRRFKPSLRCPPILISSRHSDNPQPLVVIVPSTPSQHTYATQPPSSKFFCAISSNSSGILPRLLAVTVCDGEVLPSASPRPSPVQSQ